MNKMIRATSKAISSILLCCAFHFVVPSSLAADLQAKFPISFEAKYDAFRHDKKVGNASLSLQQVSDNVYELNYTSKVSKFFLSDKRSEKTQFSYENEQITPISYDFSRKGTGPNKSLNVEFDSVKKLIKIKQEDDLPWNGEYDNQLFRIDISRQLALGKDKFEYHFLNYRGQKRLYNIEVVSDESLSLPFGKIDAIKVKVMRESKKRQTFAWFAPTLNFALVRIQQFKEGEEQGDIKLSSYEQQ